jgi:hypothetical protein
MRLHNVFIISIILGQVIFIYELILMLMYPIQFNSIYAYFNLINYFLIFLYQTLIIILFYINLTNSKLKYTLPILLVPFIGEILEGVYILFIEKSNKRIILTGIYYLLYFLAVLSSAYVIVPPGFPASQYQLKEFGITLSISDIFSLLVLLYIFILVRRWNNHGNTQ